ncbi:Yip1 domain-containing protein [Polychytrium aggregatum]|uniref:Yip1 domain-containing protein n=1 Tax=Polychytrium aggregatum TaxID=110093 RepID=UPI0022FEA686|nr:Yip1 domain-containing protein [Polychytrium aggregatum]KAI9199289.1 Yip1 domain-containing protein [Polychytrium aggregatum]
MASYSSVPTQAPSYGNDDLAAASVTIQVSDSLEGRIGQNPTAGSSGSYGGAGQTSRVNEDTLDEPVSVTIMRDLKNIWEKMKLVIVPHKANANILRDWDLWGPLLLCLVLSIRLSLTAPKEQSATVFTGIFVIIWCGAGVVTLNSKLLGGKLSFFQSVCVLGYCIFPLVAGSIASLFLPYFLIRAILTGLAFVWSCYASVGFLGDLNLSNRRALALYPMILFYFIIAWLILISKSIVG